MSDSVQTAMRKNLIWIIALIVCLAIAVGAAFNSARTPAESQQEGKKKPVMTGVDSKYVEKLMTPQPPPKTEEEKTREILVEYTEVIEDPNASEEDRVRRIYASGNLHISLGEIEDAISKFEQIILEFPDHRYAGRSYFRLFDCYSKLNDEENKRWVANQLLEKYERGTPENKWARMQLGMPLDE